MTSNSILPVVLLSLLLLGSCATESAQELSTAEQQHDTEHHDSHHHHDANAHMNEHDFEELVERFESPERNDWQNPYEVIANLGQLDGKKVMDLGAGTGYFSFKLAEKGATVIAADVDERFLDYMKNNGAEEQGIELRKTELEDPLLAENEVDHVLIVDTYHHISNRVEFFQKVAKGIKPTGRLMVVDFKKADTGVGPSVEHRMASAEVMAELKQAGFKELVLNSDMLEHQYVITATPE